MAARVAVAAALTALAHGLFFGGVMLLGVLFPRPPPKPQARPVTLRSIDRKSWATARGRFVAPSVDTREPLHPKAQVVDVAEGNHQRAPDARFLAESDNRTQKETRARETTNHYSVAAPKNAPDPTAMPAMQGKKGGGKPEPVAAAEPQPPSFIGSGRLRPSLLDLLQDPRLRGPLDGHGAGEGEGTASTDGDSRKGSDASDATTGGGAPSDVTGVEKGDATSLNTSAWMYASFLNRVKQAVAAKWDPNGTMRAKRLEAGLVDRATLLNVALRPDGSLADVFVAKGCGIDALDVEAVAAFERAAPFPNPPKGLVQNGVIAFQFTFVLENVNTGVGWMPRFQRD